MEKYLDREGNCGLYLQVDKSKALNKRSKQKSLFRETDYSEWNGERSVKEGVAEGSLGAGRLK